MITRFYVDNYKSLQNFEYKPKKFELIVGANGTGKSTVFEALDKVRRFVTGEGNAKELFPFSNKTKWNLKGTQIFELDFEIGNRSCTYHLEINLYSSFRVEKEIVKIDNQVVVETGWEPRPKDDGIFDKDPFIDENDFDDEEEHAHDIRTLKRASNLNSPATPLSDPNKSGVSFQVAQMLRQFCLIKLNPMLMTSQVKRAEHRPSVDLSNYASYYLYMLQQKQGKMFEMIPHLRESVANFDSFAVEEDFEEGRRDLRIVCQSARGKKGATRTLKYGFEELSDGQRALIALYTLLFCTLESDTTLIIDEPENYIALRELQPWLTLLEERLEEHGGQVILISHHPEFINMMAPHQAVIFERDSGGPVRIKEFDIHAASALAPAELIARGLE